MRSFSIAILLIAFTTGSAHAFDVTTAGVVQTSYVSSQLTSAPFDNKLIAEAREDAAGFVASEGQLAAARLQAALSRLRQEHPELAASDLELAEAILVQ
ncbi:MAG: Holliday junction resolvase [Pseudomonas sp. CO183]|nr:MAG: Holliday junction resolvase [Pseudomonas sp. CO183]